MQIVLVSKGPSARPIPKSNEYKIAALNDAIILCEEVDYFFCHDQDNIDIINPEEWLKETDAKISLDSGDGKDYRR
jgi:hypothetical protein